MSVMVEGSRERWFAPGYTEREPGVSIALLTSLEDADKNSHARVCEALGQGDLREGLGSVTVPVLVVGGRHDVVFPPEQQQELATAVPGARLVIVERPWSGGGRARHTPGGRDAHPSLSAG